MDEICIFATCNQVERLSLPLRSRFMELHLEEYSYEEFVEISQGLLKRRYRLNTEIAEKIAYQVWNRIKSKDIRDVLKNSKADQLLVGCRLVSRCSNEIW
jgi:Holliday junction resolvasome RuvABC ATP-dependent DNA helicase subunit